MLKDKQSEVVRKNKTLSYLYKFEEYASLNNFVLKRI